MTRNAMVVFMVLILLVVSFTVGVFSARYLINDNTDSLRLAALQKEYEALQQKKSSLDDTLALVKRQIQTNRLAVGGLQEATEQALAENLELKALLKQQRAILDQLQQRD